MAEIQVLILLLSCYGLKISYLNISVSLSFFKNRVIFRLNSLIDIIPKTTSWQIFTSNTVQSFLKYT